MQKNTLLKNIAFLSIFQFGFISSIQSQVQVTGDVLNPTTYSKEELESIARKRLVIPIKNHLGKKKMTFKANQAIRLTEYLSKITLLDSLPKNYSRYIFSIKAKDGYTVTYSWNELYNNKMGRNVFLVPKSISHPNSGVIIISKTDIHTGRRFVKDVIEIKVERK